MATFRDLLNETKARIREVEPVDAEAAIAQPGTIVLDVREPDEYEQGALPNAVHIPRGQLETSIEGKITAFEQAYAQAAPWAGAAMITDKAAGSR